MDRITHYRQVVRRLLEEYGSYKPSHGEIETEVVVDSEQDHFELMRVTLRTMRWDDVFPWGPAARRCLPLEPVHR